MTRLGSQKKPTVKWDEFRRQVLCCLYRFFHEDGSAFERIFSEFFKEHLRNRGFSNEFIAYRALYAQWRWMKRTEHNDWKFVHLETEFRTDREWKHVILIIKAIASRLGIVLREKFTEEDNTNDEMTATDPEDSEILLSSEEAMGVMIEELTSISPIIDPWSPSTTSTPPRQPCELPFRLTSETPTPSNVHLPTKSRFWPQDDEVTWKQEQEAFQTPISMPRFTTVLESPGRNEIAESEYPEESEHREEPEHPAEPEHPEEPREPAACNGMLWGFPCIWCHKDGGDKLNNEQLMTMEAAVIESYNGSTDHGSSVPLDIDDNLHLLDGHCSDEQLPMDFQLADFRTLPGLCMPESLPPVLYRWSNIYSQGINSPMQIVAGRFLHHDSTAFPPSDLDEGLFLDYVKSHVTKQPVSSPFISAFKSLLAPIHRALRNGEDAKVSIIDTSLMRTEIFKAAPLVELTGTALLNWKGYGEYLIWYEVPTAAIACTFTISRLEQIASMYPDIGRFLQLERIRERRHCTRFLYSDLAANVPESQDGHAELLDRLTNLLGVQGKVKELMVRQFRHAWTEKFCGLQYEKPEDSASDLSDDEEQQEPEPEPAPPAVQVFLGRSPRKASPADSDCTWRPQRDDSEDDSGSSTSDSGGSEECEDLMKCPRRDTPSDGYSVDDDSSVDWHRCSPVDDEDVEMAEGDWGSENEWPSDEDMPHNGPIRWSTT